MELTSVQYGQANLQTTWQMTTEHNPKSQALTLPQEQGKGEVKDRTADKVGTDQSREEMLLRSTALQTSSAILLARARRV